MKTMCVGILERADLVEPDFFGTPAVAEEFFDDLKFEEGVDRSQDRSSEEDLARDWTDEQRQAATKLYWQGLTDCVHADVAHRKLDGRGKKNWRLFDYLSHRRQGHQNAMRTLDALDRKGVDQNLLAHGDQLFQWHLTGAKVYGQAVKLLTDSPGEQLSGPLAEEWRSSATQHRMEERLVRDKHSAVAGYLDHAFPEAAPFQRGF